MANTPSKTLSRVPLAPVVKATRTPERLESSYDIAVDAVRDHVVRHAHEIAGGDLIQLSAQKLELYAVASPILQVVLEDAVDVLRADPIIANFLESGPERLYSGIDPLREIATYAQGVCSERWRSRAEIISRRAPQYAPHLEKLESIHYESTTYTGTPTEVLDMFGLRGIGTAHSLMHGLLDLIPRVAAREGMPYSSEEFAKIARNSEVLIMRLAMMHVGDFAQLYVVISGASPVAIPSFDPSYFALVDASNGGKRLGMAPEMNLHGNSPRYRGFDAHTVGCPAHVKTDDKAAGISMLWGWYVEQAQLVFERWSKMYLARSYRS
jgi:hypothetical protein